MFWPSELLHAAKALYWALITSLTFVLTPCGGFYVSGFTKDIRERVDYSLFLDKQAAKTTIILNITQFIFLLIPFCICCNVVNCTVAAFASNSRYGKLFTLLFSVSIVSSS